MGSQKCSVDDLMRKLEYMLAELEGNQLQVCLAPSKRVRNETDMIRVPLSRNANWYRSFCSKYLSTRKRIHKKCDTLIKRQHTLAALNRMLAGNLRGRYAERILQILPGVKL